MRIAKIVGCGPIRSLAHRRAEINSFILTSPGLVGNQWQIPCVAARLRAVATARIAKTDSSARLGEPAPAAVTSIAAVDRFRVKDSFRRFTVSPQLAMEYLYARLFTQNPELRTLFPLSMEHTRARTFLMLAELIESLDDPELSAGCSITSAWTTGNSASRKVITRPSSMRCWQRPLRSAVRLDDGTARGLADGTRLFRRPDESGRRGGRQGTAGLVDWRDRAARPAHADGRRSDDQAGPAAELPAGPVRVGTGTEVAASLAKVLDRQRPSRERPDRPACAGGAWRNGEHGPGQP